MVNRARRRAGRRVRPAAAILAAAALASSCMANPDDAPLVEDEAAPGADVPAGPVDPEDPALELHVGVDDFGEGFNPHMAADATPVTDLVASLTLPSAFVPAAPAGGGLATGLTRNTDLLDSAGPVDPKTGRQLTGTLGERAVHSSSFRIRYVIAPEAQWSDGTPISGADFRYLHEGMIATPGVREAAAYEAIRSIQVSDGGRTVDVDIAGPLPQWRTLFDHLLPSHLLRPTGRSFADVMDTAIVASGSTYVAESVDVGRREIRLVRNSRFWGAEPPLTERIIIRHDRGPVDGAEQMRTDQLQAAFVRPEETTGLTYGSVPGATVLLEARPRMLTLQANVTSPLLPDAAARRAVLRLVDVPTVAAVATGRTSGLDIPPPLMGTLDGPVGATPDRPLVIGVVGDSAAVAAARAIADQLTSAGVPAAVSAEPAEEVAGALLPHGDVDLVVAWVDQVESMLGVADRFSCPSPTRESHEPDRGARRDVERQDGEGTGDGDTSTATSSPVTETTSGGTETAEVPGGAPLKSGGGNGPDVARGANLSGLCSPELEQLLDRHGTAAGSEVAEHIVGSEAVELPIVADSTLTVVGPGMRDDRGTSPRQWASAPLEGVFMNAPHWVRVDPEEAPSTTPAPATPSGTTVAPEPAADRPRTEEER